MQLHRRYLAGLLDGEGYFGIMRGPKSRTGQGSYYVPTIKMATTHPDILRLVVQTLGGHISLRVFSPQQNYKDAWWWTVRTFTTVQRALAYVKPYLIIKHPQAEVLEAFLLTVQPAGNVRSLPQAVLEERARLYALMVKLNHRGRPLAETKRECPASAGEAIVRPIGQPMEAPRNAVLAATSVLSQN